MQSAAMLWTGGRDSSLTFYESEGEYYTLVIDGPQLTRLITIRLKRTRNSLAYMEMHEAELAAK